jgi:aminoglycoside phosphotransferase (APT) family kinase protein
MATSPLILAALAKAAMPSVSFRQVRELETETDPAIDVAVITDTEGNQYLIRHSRGPKGNLKLAAENQMARAIRQSGTLPFAIHNVVAETTTANGNTVSISNFIFGKTVEFESLDPAGEVVPSLGVALAAIHNLNTDRVRSLGVPEFSANQIRESKLASLDAIAATGKVSKVLLQRWETALEDLDLFRFNPTVIHGTLETGRVLEQDGQITGILGWSETQIGDPAADFASFGFAHQAEVLDSIRFAYFAYRSEADNNLAARATLYAELNLGQYLVFCINNGRDSEIDWITTELGHVEADVESGQARILSTSSFAQTTPVFDDEQKTRPIEIIDVEDDDQLF